MIKQTTQDNKIYDYIFTYNLNWVLIFCTFFTLYTTLGLVVNRMNEIFIRHATIILFLYLSIVLIGIWIQKKKRNIRIYYEIIFTLFYLVTLITMYVFTNDFTNSFGFLFVGIVLFQLITMYLYMPTSLNIIIMLIVTANGIMSTIRLDGEITYIWILLTVMLCSMLSSYLHYKSLLKTVEHDRRIKEMAHVITQISNRDTLTNLYNNNFINEQMKFEIERSTRYHTPLCLLILDIDNFKRVNTKYGQVVGDETLTVVSNILSKICRTTDIIGRFSGAEFIVLLPNTSLDESIMLAERLRITISKHDFEIDDPLTVSVGLTEFINQTSKEMIESCELNVQVAKSEGRNRISY